MPDAALTDDELRMLAQMGDPSLYLKLTSSERRRLNGLVPMTREMAAGIYDAERTKDRTGRDALAAAYVQRGPTEVKEGLKDAASGRLARGANRVVKGGMVTALPMVLPSAAASLLAAPVTVGAGLAGSVVGGEMGERTGRALGLDPDTSELMGTVGSIGIGMGAERLAQPALDWASRRLMQSALKPGVADMSKDVTDLTPRAVQSMLDERINMTRAGARKLDRVVKQSEQSVDDALAQIPEPVVNPARVAQRVDEVAARRANQGRPASDLERVRAVKQEYMDTWGNDFQTLSQTQRNKQGTYRAIGESAFNKTSHAATEEADMALARGMKEEIEREYANYFASSGQKPPIDIKSVNARQGSAIEALDPLMRRLHFEANKNPAGLGSLVVTQPVAFITWLFDRWPAAKSMVANGMYRELGKATGLPPVMIATAVRGASQLPADDTKETPR